MSYIEPHMVESLKDHVLEEIMEPATVKHPRFKPGQTVRVFRCGRPDSGIHSTILIFTPFGISIGGDTILGHGANPHGVWCAGYTLDWFAGRLDEHYLCSKFYRECWQPEVAIQWCRAHAKEILEGERDSEYKALRLAHDAIETIESHGYEDEKEEDLPRLRKEVEHLRDEYSGKFIALAEEMDNGDGCDVRRFAEELEGLGYTLDGCSPGYDYPLAEAGWLCALQKKFAELYQAKYAVPATEVGA